MSARLFFDPDDADARPTFSANGVVPSDMAKRVEAVLAEGHKRIVLPLGPTTHADMRGYIARLRLSPPRLMGLAMTLGTQAAGLARTAAATATSADSLNATIAFYCYRAALSLLVEVEPRAPIDADDLLGILLVWPGALPPSLQPHVAAAIGAHVADTITGRPFKRRRLVPRKRKAARR